MDSKYKIYPKFQIVRHRRIKLKTKPHLLSESLLLTSCLNRCDNYYFSPSKVSLISSLPEFKFKSQFNYNRIKRNKITLKTSKKLVIDNSSKNKSKKISKPSDFRSNVSKRSHLFTELLNLSEDTDNYFDTNQDLNSNRDQRVETNEDFNQNSVKTPENISPENDILVNPTEFESRSHTKPKNITKTTTLLNLSEFELKLDKIIDQKLTKFRQSLEQISERTIKWSTPVNQSTRHRLLDISSIRYKRRDQTVRSVAVQVVEQKSDKMTQTFEMCDKSVQTGLTSRRDHSNNISSSEVTYSRISSRRSSSLTPWSFTTDSDPECPFTPRIRQFIRQSI